ncbi:SDR family NAD(P)-dependent oxidoreductase [Iningainema tapete]|uniref:SDR family NAD(P)-dependent oxidoreductase n=1 Tax=Iningainema tapete BLCC-T55 TaxID=2748662 RepID=A0A8J6XJZ7_9CYAN|nr:SDR family NAD(P)-dependent oxidoreductase [Iningainema tapete]MBD2774282.1 SDR family NAD(P)-dependent oxidoreductase [Iningainema tapete BLCC-T55]
MDLQLKNKRALVTGSSSGIGEAIAKTLAREGVSVVVHGRSEERTNRVAQEITADGGKAIAAVSELDTDEGAKTVADKALSSLGGVDILINNAGAAPMHSWMDTTAEQWVQLYNANVGSMVRLIKLLVPQMKELGWGRIIQIGSAVGTQPMGGQPDYAATKAVNINMTVSLAKELAGTGITANTISPGPIETAGFDELVLQIGEAQGWGTNLAQIKANILKGIMSNPANRLGTPEDVAYAVTFISSPLAGYINGANLRVDGGWTQTIN